MFEIKGKNTTAKVYLASPDKLEETARKQIQALIDHVSCTNQVCIMPDVHAGVSSPIGFTVPVNDKVIPNAVSVDIGCGMLTICLSDSYVNLEELDKVIKNFIPSGFNRQKNITKENYEYAKKVVDLLYEVKD